MRVFTVVSQGDEVAGRRVTDIGANDSDEARSKVEAMNLEISRARGTGPYEILEVTEIEGVEVDDDPVEAEADVREDQEG